MEPIQWRDCPERYYCCHSWFDRVTFKLMGFIPRYATDWVRISLMACEQHGRDSCVVLQCPSIYSDCNVTLFFFPLQFWSEIPGPEKPFLQQITPKLPGSHAQFKFQWSGIFQWKKKCLIEKFLTSSNPINFTVVAHMLMRAVCVRLLLNLQNTIPRTCILYVVWHRHIWFIFCILKQYYEHFIRLQK